jgi:predicted nucleic acid-binding protein
MQVTPATHSAIFQLGNSEVALSVLMLLELAHGAARADTLERKSMREQFIEELLTALPRSSYHCSSSFAYRTIDGANQARGVRLPLADRLIGVTTLELGYGIATRNVRHFHMIHGLSVMRFLLFDGYESVLEAASVWEASSLTAMFFALLSWHFILNI